ncbi:hypothetical protein BTVI_106970 [Pitangus sulphuratus]|nr:hypothetical protein BTVI_106970 [Pitangus sulphuratus]
MAQKDWYQVLGAEPSDSPAELKRKYQKLALLTNRIPKVTVLLSFLKTGDLVEKKKGGGISTLEDLHSIQDLFSGPPVSNSDNINCRCSGDKYGVNDRYHPDKQEADVPAGEAEQRVQRFIEVDQAWKILGNEETKKEYDLQRRADNLTKEWPLHEQVYLEDMSWNEDEQLYTLSCRCGGSYSVSRSETKDVSVVCCDTCSLVIQILQ